MAKFAKRTKPFPKRHRVLVSHRKKFIYLKTVKTASTSVESFFEPYCMPEGTWEFEKFRNETVTVDGIVGYRGVKQRKWFGLRRRKWFDHMPAIHVRSQLPPEQWDEYFKFCVIRNPFDRVISAFHFFQWMENRGLYEMPVPQLDNEIDRFRLWVKVGIGPNTPVFDRGCYVIDNQICLDFFIRFENLEEDLTAVCRRLEIEPDLATLKTMVGGVRPKVPIADYYDAESQSFVEKTYQFELSQFDYRFPASS